MLTSDLFENKTPAAWRAGYERGLRYYRQGPDNPYPSGSQEAKDYADGYHNGELDSYDKYDTSTMNEGAVKELSQDLRSMSDEEFLARYKMTKAQARAGMKSGVAESYPKHQDLSGISTDKLKAYLAKQSQQSVPGEGNQVKRVRAELQRRQQGLAEVSKATLDRYVPKAVDAHGHADFAARQSKDDPTLRSYHKSQAQTAEKRRQGISRALDRMSKTEGVAEGLDKQALQKELIIINKLIKDMKNSWQQQHLLQKKQELLKQLKQGVAEGSGPKEKQKTPYRDINSPEYRAAADKQKQRMAKDKAAEPGKKMLAKQGVAEGSLNEFAPGAGGDDEAGDDPYKYPKPKRYNRSADYFEQFEADHFDREDFDDDTGVFKGYWGNTQIAYFKFDNPARTGGNNPGMGWYYEPQTNNRGDDTAAAPAADDSAERKQQELSMIRAFLKSGNRPNPDSQIGRLMKKHGLAEADDSKFVGFMNKTMSNKVDAPKADTLAGAPDFYRNAAVSTLDARPGFKNALKFGLKALSRLDLETRQQLAAGSEQAVEEYLTDVAERSGQMGDDTFVEEDISEVQDYLNDVFHDPSINSWKDVLQQSRGVAEEQLTEQDLAEAVSTLELADFLFKGLEQKFPKIIERYGHEVVGNAIMDVAEENLDVSSFSEIDMLIDDIIEKLQNYNGNDSGLTESTVSRLYYNVVGTSAPELRKDFGMRHDRQGWFLSESSGRNRIMDAQRAFGSPKLVEYSVSDATGGAAQLGPDNVVSPVGSVPKSQRINTKKRKSNPS